MLIANKAYRRSSCIKNQDGVVLVIALIVLVAMTLAGLALMRSVDTTNLIAGNLAFQQSATNSADAGVEAAINWLQTAGDAALTSSDPTNGYTANGSAAGNSPVNGQSWDDFWVRTLSARQKTITETDEAGNTISYVIDRMCNNTGAKTGGASCSASPAVTVATGNSEDPSLQLTGVSVVYYRVTVRVAGPKNTVSYVQAMVAL